MSNLKSLAITAQLSNSQTDIVYLILILPVTYFSKIIISPQICE